MQNGESATAARLPSSAKVFRMISFVLLLSLGAIVESSRLLSLRSPEIWGHLQMGQWILQHKSWPRTGLFSQAANFPWRDFSWGYDGLAALAYRLAGLRALPALQMGFCVVLAGITFLLAGGRRGKFWSAVAFSVVAQYVLSEMGPVPAAASVVLFGVELLLLLEIRRSGNLRLLFVLPVLSLLWSNLDLGFVYGIGLYLLFIATLAAEKMSLAANWHWVERPSREIPLRAAALAGCVGMLAGLVTPYGYHGYASFFANQFSAANRYLPGYTAMRFHQPRDYVLLLLAMSAFLYVGRQRSRDFFQLGALIACTALSFHAQRENWLVTLAAVSTIGEAILPKSEKAVDDRWFHWNKHALASVGLTSAAVFLAFALRVPHERQVLLGKIAENFPVHACDVIRQHQFPAPLFNSYAWGNFLMWYLPEYPVAIDGRRGLYPMEEEINYFKVMNGDVPYRSLPVMKQARTLLLDKQGMMGEALRDVPGFHVAYEDDISIVLLQEEQ